MALIFLPAMPRPADPPCPHSGEVQAAPVMSSLRARHRCSSSTPPIALLPGTASEIGREDNFGENCLDFFFFFRLRREGFVLVGEVWMFFHLRFREHDKNKQIEDLE